MVALLAALSLLTIPAPPPAVGPALPTMLAEVPSANGPAEAAGSMAAPRHFTECPHRTGGSAVIIVPSTAQVATSSWSLAVGDEIAVVAPDGSCAGVGVWDGDGMAVTVWEDDPFTPERDGLLPGDPLTFSTYDESEGVVHAFATVAYDRAYGEGDAYSRDALFVLSMMEATSTTEPTENLFALGQSFPNPASGRISIPFSLASRGPATVEVFDALGRLVARPLAGDHAAGTHEVPLDVSGLAPGLYVYRLTAGGDVQQRTLTVAR